MFALLAGLLFYFEKTFGEGRDFAEYRDEIKVVSSSMQVSQTDKGRYVSVVGLLTNRSEFTWKEVQLEARYFDKDGKLIDTGLERNLFENVLPYAEAAFR